MRAALAMASSCTDGFATVTISDPESAIVNVVLAASVCCNPQDWARTDTTHEHAFDRLSFWNDAHFWNDVQPIYDSHVFNLLVCSEYSNLCCYYCTGDEAAYSTGNHSLYGVTLDG